MGHAMHDSGTILDISPQTGDSTQRIQRAIDQASANGGHVRLLSGVHFSGTLRLRSNLTLEIVTGATLKAIDAADAFPAIQSSVYSRMDVAPWKAFLHADSVENIRLTGRGVIDGSGELPFFQNGISVSPDRPYGLHFVNVRNLAVEGLTLRNSAYWMLRTLECENVRIRDLDIENHVNLNNDGIDIDSSRDVQIRGCRIDTSDDALCVKSEGASPCENIIASDCILASHASAIKLGTASIGGFRNISISNIVIRRSRSRRMLHPLKFWGGICGIDIAAVDGGPLQSVTITNVIMDGPAAAIFLRHGNRLSRQIALGGDCTVSDRSNDQSFDFPESRCFQNVRIGNVIASNLSGYPVVVCGYPGAPIRRAALHDITLIHTEVGTDLEPPTEFNDSGYPNIGMFGSRRDLQFITKLNAHGLFTRCVESLQVERFTSSALPADPRPWAYHCDRIHPAESTP